MRDKGIDRTSQMNGVDVHPTYGRQNPEESGPPRTERGGGHVLAVAHAFCQGLYPLLRFFADFHRARTIVECLRNGPLAQAKEFAEIGQRGRFSGKIVTHAIILP